MIDHEELTCQELVELVTDYLEEMLSPPSVFDLTPTWRTATAVPGTLSKCE